MLALVLQVIWNFGTEGLMNEFGGTGCPGVAEIFFFLAGWAVGELLLVCLHLYSFQLRIKVLFE